MIIVAGPPGGGKSSHLTVKKWGVDWFNSDDRAAQLNAGSYQNIPAQVRKASGQQLQQFIESHIESRRSFVFESFANRYLLSADSPGERNGLPSSHELSWSRAR
jgi:predicted ABC-type ATPase